MTNFKQTGSVWSKFVTLTDASATGSQLFNGSTVYCFTRDVSFSGNIHMGVQPVMNPTPAPDYVGSNVGSVWNKLINNTSYSGIDNHVIKAQGTWVVDIGSADMNGNQILTPYKIVLMASSGHTFYLKDERIIEQIIIESGSAFYGTSGIPVAIKAYDIKAMRTDDNRVDWSLTLQEDKV